MNAISIEDLLADRVRAHRALNMLPTNYFQHQPITGDHLVQACGQLRALVTQGAITERDSLLALETLSHHSTIGQQHMVTPEVPMTTGSATNIGQQHSVAPGVLMTTGLATNITSPSDNIIMK
jgi:hypothetical protein